MSKHNFPSLYNYCVAGGGVFVGISKCNTSEPDQLLFCNAKLLSDVDSPYVEDKGAFSDLFRSEIDGKQNTASFMEYFARRPNQPDKIYDGLKNINTIAYNNLHTDWYIPAISELRLASCYAAEQIRTSGQVLLSSTHGARTNMAYVMQADGNAYLDLRRSLRSVIFMRRMPITDFL